MNTNEENLLYRDLSFRIIGFAMQVHNELGHGFLEKVYENVLMVILKREGILARQFVFIREHSWLKIKK